MAVIHPQILVRLNHKDRLARSFAALDGQFPLFDPGIRVAEKFKLRYRKTSSRCLAYRGLARAENEGNREF